ncbi:MAG: BtpA/SgcQ family protein [Blastocatellia bacterium]
MLTSLFPNPKPIIGMIHVGALPGTPANTQSVAEITAQAVREAAIYRDCGIDGVLIENMHDVPYLRGQVGPEIVAAMAVIGNAVKTESSLPTGIQVLAGANLEAMAAVYQATVPWVSIILRRVFGVAGAASGNAQALNLRYAWPSGDWGSLPIEGGVQAAYKRDIESSPDPDARRQEIEAMLNELRSPFRTAEAFGIEEIIDPRDTRPLLCDWIGLAYELLPEEPGVKRRGMRP